LSTVDEAVAAIRAGEAVVLPFDTVYGLAADPYHDQPTSKLYRLKGRDETKPSALVACDVDYLLECVPELRGRSATIARELLPGPYTLIFPNPAERFRWLSGPDPHAIGVRVPDVVEPCAEVLTRVGALVATSANHPGEQDPAALEDVPEDIRRGAAAVVDGGRLRGSPSTVIDFTGPEPRVLRRGAASGSEALERVAALVAGARA
jgi:tRNA threonylcarbamoyl adenosine modification protein (Sua5/YciO/YrdC/YwlC family)